MPNDAGFVPFVVDQLGDGIGGIGASARATFGGHGLYADGVSFGVVAWDQLFFQTDEATRGAYVARGMPVLAPSPGQTLGAYFQVPDAVWDEAPELREWASAGILSRAPVPCPERLK